MPDVYFTVSKMHFASIQNIICIISLSERQVPGPKVGWAEHTTAVNFVCLQYFSDVKTKLFCLWTDQLQNKNNLLCQILNRDKIMLGQSFTY